MYALGALGREQREMAAAVEADRAFLQRCVHPRGVDASVAGQDQWFEFRVLRFHISTLEASLCFWGACGWDSKVISQESTDAGHSEKTVFVILFRARSGPAPGLSPAVLEAVRLRRSLR